MLTEQPNPRTANIDQLPTLEMLRVINEEDAKVAQAVKQALPTIAQAVDTIAEHLRQGGHVFYVGAGSSGRVGVEDAVEWTPTFGVPTDTVQSIFAGGEEALAHSAEGAEDDRDAGYAEIHAHGVTARDVVVGIAASGRTPFVLGALDAANAIGAVTIAVTCNRSAPILERVQIGIVALVGPEVIAGSTRLKAGTAQKMILNMLSTGSMIRLGKVYGNLMVDVAVTNQKLAQRARRVVMQIADVDEEEAQRLLEAANLRAKPAIVMARCGVSAQQANAMLEREDGMLRRVLGTCAVA